METKQILQLINGKLKETIQKGIYNHFGVNTDIHANADSRGNIVIVDDMHDVCDKMTGNKFLRRFINDARLYGYPWFDEDSNAIRIPIRVMYNHPTGGSNGKDLGSLVVYLNNKRTQYLSY